MTTSTYPVTGMTCAHCVTAVTQELSAVEGVNLVEITLDPGATSTVTVVSDSPLADEQVAAALDEAGDYHLAS
ncbi:heavy-metal-associated domain-containing protein [Jatrophihabitans sp. YIM 134969]